MNLDTQHTDYIATATERQRGRDLYDGERVVRAAGETYLQKGKNESTDDFDRRLARSVLDPYVEKIITARQAVLFRKAHGRELPGRLADLEPNVDRKRTPARVFFEQAAREAQVAGIEWVCIDMPRAPEGGFKSAGQEEAFGHRPFFEHVPAEAVIDWYVGFDLELDWAVVKLSTPNLREKWGEAITHTTQWKVWTRTAWYLYEAADTDAKASDGGYTVVDEGENTSGVVPLVPFFGVPKGDWSGWPVALPVFGHVLAVYNKQSDLDWFEQVAAHPIPYSISPDKPELLDAGKGMWLKSVPGHTVHLGYLEPTGAAFRSHRETIREYQSKIYALALAQAQKDSAQVQSADGQREDRKIFTASLASVARRNEAAELRCWETAAQWLGENGTPKITYNTDFDDTAIEATMIAALGQLVDGEVLTRRTVLQTITRGEVVEVEDLDAELEAAGKEGEERRKSAADAAVSDLVKSGEAV